MANKDGDEIHPHPSASDRSSDAEKAGINHKCTVSSESGGESTFRTQVGRHLSTLTDVVNDNLIIVRSATFATVFLVGAYGIANTPLFYRHKNLNDIASKVFTKRQRIHGRIVGILDSNKVASSNVWNDASVASSSTLNKIGNDITQTHQKQKPVTILFRHSSVMERLLPQSAMESILQFSSGRNLSPSGLINSSSKAPRNLLPIELAGIVSFSLPTTNTNTASKVLSQSLSKGASFKSSSQQVPEALQSLIDKKVRVSLQMLALRSVKTPRSGAEESTTTMMDESRTFAAICHLSYKKPNQWLNTTNLGLELIQRGQALVNQEGLIVPEEHGNSELIDFNPTIKQLHADSSFISKLEEAEFKAWKAKEGAWSSLEMRELRKEYVEEDRYLNSSLWSKMKNGLKWIIGIGRK